MIVSAQGADFIRQREQLRLTAYLDTIADPPVWTVGYGQTGPGIVEGLVWTRAQAESEFRAAVGAFELKLAALLKYQVTQQQFDALASLGWNIGLGALGKSTLLALFNQGEVDRAALEFTKWCHAGGKVVDGLLARRTAELVIFLVGYYP